MEFDENNRYYAGYKEARDNGVPLTELYATAFNALAEDMTLGEIVELEAYIDKLKSAILCETMYKAGYTIEQLPDDLICLYKKVHA